MLCSSLLLLLCILFSQTAVCEWKLFVIAMLSGISLAVYSPLENENRILDSEEKCRYKKITAVFTAGLQIPVIFEKCFRQDGKKVSRKIFLTGKER